MASNDPPKAPKHVLTREEKRLALVAKIIYPTPFGELAPPNGVGYRLPVTPGQTAHDYARRLLAALDKFDAEESDDGDAGGTSEAKGSAADPSGEASS